MGFLMMVTWLKFFNGNPAFRGPEPLRRDDRDVIMVSVSVTLSCWGNDISVCVWRACGLQEVLEFGCAARTRAAVASSVGELCCLGGASA